MPDVRGEAQPVAVAVEVYGHVSKRGLALYESAYPSAQYRRQGCGRASDELRGHVAARRAQQNAPELIEEFDGGKPFTRGGTATVVDVPELDSPRALGGAAADPQRCRAALARGVRCVVRRVEARNVEEWRRVAHAIGEAGAHFHGHGRAMLRAAHRIIVAGKVERVLELRSCHGEVKECGHAAL